MEFNDQELCLDSDGEPVPRRRRLTRHKKQKDPPARNGLEAKPPPRPRLAFDCNPQETTHFAPESNSPVEVVSSSSLAEEDTEQRQTRTKPILRDLLKRRVRVRWNAQEEYDGKVADICEEENTIYVIYDDGDKQWEQLNTAVTLLPTTTRNKRSAPVAELHTLPPQHIADKATSSGDISDLKSQDGAESQPSTPSDSAEQNRTASSKGVSPSREKGSSAPIEFELEDIFEASDALVAVDAAPSQPPPPQPPSPPPPRQQPSPPPALRIEQIHIAGFKTFALPTCVGPFPDFSCIVGPNGAGKSSVKSSC